MSPGRISIAGTEREIATSPTSIAGAIEFERNTRGDNPNEALTTAATTHSTPAIAPTVSAASVMIFLARVLIS